MKILEISLESKINLLNNLKLSIQRNKVNQNYVQFVVVTIMKDAKYFFYHVIIIFMLIV